MTIKTIICHRPLADLERRFKDSSNRLLKMNSKHELVNENTYGTVLWSIFGLVLLITIANCLSTSIKNGDLLSISV